jgi:hypothetical protein
VRDDRNKTWQEREIVKIETSKRHHYYGNENIFNLQIFSNHNSLVLLYFFANEKQNMKKRHRKVLIVEHHQREERESCEIVSKKEDF